MSDHVNPNQVLKYVISVPDKEFSNISVSSLAASFNVNRFKLLRQFKLEMNMTLGYFLFREKMMRAAILLAEHENMTVKVVSEKIGYCNSDYFIKIFKNYFGISPGLYKQMRQYTH